MWKKILCTITLSVFLFNFSNMNCYAEGTADKNSSSSQSAQCNSMVEVNNQVVEYGQLVVNIAEEDDKSTPEKLENQNYVVTTETSFCDENPYAPSCKPPPTKTTPITSHSPFDLTEEDRRGLYANSNTYQCEDIDGNPLPDVSCDDMEILKTKRNLYDDGFFCSSKVNVRYMNLDFTLYSNHFENLKMYVKDSNPNDLVAGFYLWDGTTNDPIYYHYELEMLQFVSTYTTTVLGEAGVYDTSLDYIDGTRVYDFYLMNIDNPRARYAHKYHLVYGLTPDSGIGPSSTTGQEIILDANPNKDQGRNILKRVRFQDDKWIRNFGANASWVCTWIGDNGNSIVVWPTGGYNNAGITWRYYRMKESVKIKISENGSTSATFPDGILNALYGSIHHGGATVTATYIYDYENPHSAWKDVVELKKLNDQAEVYGGIKRGEIEIDVENGIWIWHQHRQQNEYSGVLEPPFTIDNNTYRVCMGEYHCDCEDINVLCSCEDEEAGCSPEIACPDGQSSCSGPPADGETGNPNDPEGLGESKPKINSLGFSVPSGGPGGVTGTGSKDYYEKYLEGSSTLLH